MPKVRVRGGRTLRPALVLVVVCVLLASTAISAGPGSVTGGSVGGREVGMWYSTWYTAKRPWVWTRGHGLGSNRQLLGDVNADNRADAIAYFGTGGLAGNWYVAAAAPPELVVINSFNEFFEETAVQPADTSGVRPPSEPWPSPTSYWDLNRQYIAAFKSAR